jgi:hypothetical protein
VPPLLPEPLVDVLDEVLVEVLVLDEVLEAPPSSGEQAPARHDPPGHAVPSGTGLKAELEVDGAQTRQGSPGLAAPSR